MRVYDGLEENERAMDVIKSYLEEYMWTARHRNERNFLDVLP